MSRRALALLSTVNDWTLTDAAGQPSAALTTRLAETRLGAPVGAITGTVDAAGHRASAAFAAVDVREVTDLELWVKGDRAADGSPGAPWYLELRLGSAANRVGAAQNHWHRFLPVPASDTWSPVLISVDDLPDDIRSGVSEIRLTCVDASRSFRCAVDGVWAIRDEPLPDVDAALFELLDKCVSVDGHAVRLALDPAPASAQPVIRARTVATEPLPEQVRGSGTRTDFTGKGFSLRAPAMPVQFTYEVRVDAADRAAQAHVFNAVFQLLTTTTTLDVSGRPASMRFVDSGPAGADAAASATPALTVTITSAVRPHVPARPATPPFNSVTVEADHRASA